MTRVASSRPKYGIGNGHTIGCGVSSLLLLLHSAETILREELTLFAAMVAVKTLVSLVPVGGHVGPPLQFVYQDNVAAYFHNHYLNHYRTKVLKKSSLKMVRKDRKKLTCNGAEFDLVFEIHWSLSWMP
jgi:hypothetical protein